MSKIIAKPKDDFSQGYFELYYIFYSAKNKDFTTDLNFLGGGPKKIRIFIFDYKSVQIIAEPNDDFSHDHFELNYVFLAQNFESFAKNSKL